MLRNLPNAELARLYDSELVLKLHNEKNLRDTRTVLSHFMSHLGAYPPSPELAKSFLAQYTNREIRTLYRYTQMIRGFMRWYGEPIDDVKIKVPKTLPPYTEDSDIERLLAVIPKKRSHRGCIERDQLIVLVAWRTGLRRGELASLLVRDVHRDALIVRGGKGKKDRMIPLTQDVALRLHKFIKNKGPDERVFGLSAPSIGMKIKQFAKKAGLSDFHTHTLRHKYATDVLESGTNVRVLQVLMGHENLNTTQVYLSITDKDLHAVAERLDKHANMTAAKKERESSGEIEEKQAGNGSRDDFGIVALQMILHPDNLCLALVPEGVGELQLDKLPVVSKSTADRLRGLLRNDV